MHACMHAHQNYFSEIELLNLKNSEQIKSKLFLKWYFNNLNI